MKRHLPSWRAWHRRNPWTRCSSWEWLTRWVRLPWQISSASMFAWIFFACCMRVLEIRNTALVRCWCAWWTRDGLAARRGAGFTHTRSRVGVMGRYEVACLLSNMRTRSWLIVFLVGLLGCHETGNRDRDVQNA